MIVVRMSSSLPEITHSKTCICLRSDGCDVIENNDIVSWITGIHV